MTRYRRAMILTLFGLISGLAVVGFWFSKSTISSFFQEKETPSPELLDQSSVKDFKPPLSLDHSQVTSALLHYFLTGTIKSVKGNQIYLDTKGDNSLPSLIISPETRISKITLPYSASTSVSITVRELRPGQTVDISVEYDLRSKTWLLRDVFLPTERN